MKHPKDMTVSELFDERQHVMEVETCKKPVDKKDYLKAFKELFTTSVDKPLDK